MGYLELRAVLPEEFSGMKLKGICNLDDHFEAWVPFSPLNPANVCAVQINGMGKTFLRISTLFAQFSQAVAKILDCEAFLHPRIGRKRGSIVHGLIVSFLRITEEMAMNLFEQHMIETTGKHPGLDLDPHLHRKLRLKASDVSVEYAQRHIRKFEHLLGFMLAAFQMREDGGHANLKHAMRIEQMCLLHPHFCEKAKEMLVDPMHANAGARK